MISAQFVWGNVFLDESYKYMQKTKQKQDKTKIENVESALYMKSVSLPLYMKMVKIQNV